MIRHFPSRFLAITSFVMVAVVPDLRAEIALSNLSEWREQYKAVADQVEKKLATGDEAVQENDPRVQLAARILTAEAKFNGPGKEVDLWYKRVAGIIDSGKAKPENQQKFLKVFAAESARTALRVLESPAQDRKLQTGVSIARLMAKLAEYGQEDSLYVLLPLLDSSAQATGLKKLVKEGPLPDLPKSQNEGAMYYAARGVANFYDWRSAQQKPPDIDNKELTTEVLATLVRILGNPEGVSDDAPAPRLDGYCMMRREVIRALGRSRNPSLKLEKEELLIALELGRILHGTKVTPAPRLDERVEAAIALLSLDPTLRKDYQPDYAASKIGEFTVLFAEKFRKDAKNEETMKFMGLRLAEALARKNKAKDASDYEKKMSSAAIEVLLYIDSKVGLKGNPADLSDFVKNNPVSTESFYKGVESATLKGNPAPIKDPGDR